MFTEFKFSRTEIDDMGEKTTVFNAPHEIYNTVEVHFPAESSFSAITAYFTSISVFLLLLGNSALAAFCYNCETD